MGNYSAGEVRAVRDLVDQMKAGRRLTAAEMGYAEVVLRADYLRRIAAERNAESFGGRAVRDDYPSLSEIERRFGAIDGPTRAEQAEQARHDAINDGLDALEAERTEDLLAWTAPRTSTRSDA